MSQNRRRELVKEQPHQKKAFEHYYSLGEHRSYAKVAAEFGVGESTVKLWGKSFRWKERIQERDLQVVREVASQSLDVEVSRRERGLQIVQMAVLQLARAIAEGEVKMSLSDLDRLVRLEAFLSNEPDSRQEIVIGELRGKSDEDLRKLLREEMSLLKEIGVEETDLQESKP